LVAAGYAGQKVVLLAATDQATINNMSEVAADMLRKVGINLDYQTTDFGSVLTRAKSREPVEKGGWSLYVSGYYGSSVISPAPHNWLHGKRYCFHRWLAGQPADRGFARPMAQRSQLGIRTGNRTGDAASRLPARALLPAWPVEGRYRLSPSGKRDSGWHGAIL
jgi:hypothetical protein